MEILLLPLTSSPLKATEPQGTTCENNCMLSSESLAGNEVEVENEHLASNEIGVENEDQIQGVNEHSCDKPSSLNPAQSKDSSVIVKEFVNKKVKSVRSDHRIQYKSSWESLMDAQYKTYIF